MMKRLKITGNFYDCRIYDGYVLYLLEDGTLVIDEYENYKDLLRQDAELAYLSINDIRGNCRQFDLSHFMPILDILVKDNKLFLASLKGLFQIDLFSLMERKTLDRVTERKFDGKVISLSAKQNKMLVSADYNGLFVTNILEGNGGIENIADRPIATKSILSSWAKYDIVNYVDSESPDFLISETEKYEQGKRTMYRLKTIGVETIGVGNLVNERRIYTDEKGVVFSYADNEEMYFLTKNHHLYKNSIIREDKVRLSIRPVRYSSYLLKETPLSMVTIGNYCVMELFDKVVAFQHNGKLTKLEEGGIMNVSKCRPSSFDRNVLVATKEDSVSFIYFSQSKSKETKAR